MIVVLLKLVAVLLRWLPRPISRGFGWFLGRLYGDVFRIRRGEILERLQRCFPDKSEAERRAIRSGMYTNMGHTFIDLLRLSFISPEQMRAECIWIDRHHLDAAFKRGQGVVIITAHVGSWETIAALGPLEGYPETIVVKTVRPPALDQYMAALRGRFGTHVLPRKGSYRKCLRALKNQNILGFIIDQNMRPGQGVFVDFFGQPASTSPGAAMMAWQAGSPIVPIFAVRQADGTHQIHCLPEIEPPRSRDESEIVRCTQDATAALESIIRQYPEQWIWMHRRWRTTPEEVAAFEAGRAEGTIDHKGRVVERITSNT